MKVYNLTENERAASGGYTTLAVLSFADGDFSEASTSQTYAPVSIGAGDLIDYPLAKVYVKTAVAGLTSPVLKVGYDAGSDDDDFLLGATSGVSLATAGAAFGANLLSASAGGPVTTATAASMVGVLLTISASNNIENATAGEVHVYLAYHTSDEHSRVS